jgi:PAS domain-containing protein
VVAEDIVGETDLGHAVVEPRGAAARAVEERGCRCRTRAPVKFEATHPRHDGSMSWADCSMSAVRNGRGEVTMLVSESRDVTGRVRAHEALLLSGARYRTLIESAPEAIVVLDVATGHFVDCNQKACEMFGATVADLRSLGVLDLSPPAQADGRASGTVAPPIWARPSRVGAPCSSGRTRRSPGASSLARSRWSGCRIPSGR